MNEAKQTKKKWELFFQRCDFIYTHTENPFRELKKQQLKVELTFDLGEEVHCKSSN